MSIGTYGYVEIGSPRISGGGDGIQVTRRFSGPWINRAEFLRHVFGSYDGNTYVAPKTLVECYHELYPQKFSFEYDDSQPVAKVSDVSSEWWGPGLTAPGESAATENNTDWGCCTIAITWGPPKSGGRSSDTAQTGTTVSRRYNAYVEAQETPGRAWEFTVSGAKLPEDMPQHILINVIEVEVTISNLYAPPWAAAFGLVGYLNSTSHEGFAPGALLYMGAQIDSAETIYSDTPIYTMRLSYLSKLFRGQPIFNKTFDIVTGDFQAIQDSQGNPPHPSGDLSLLYA